MKEKQFIIVVMICLCPLIASAVTFDDMLGHHPSKVQPFMGEHKNIKWISHTPDALKDPEAEKAAEESVTGPNAEADDRGQVDVGRIDLDGDGKEETIKVIWNGGVTDHILTIEVYRYNKLISTLKGGVGGGIQSNFKIMDVDGDGKKEIIIWSGLWDFRLPGEEDVTEATCEGHSMPHRYVVATYKFIKGNEFRKDDYCLWAIYTTEKKYEPFCEQMPKE